MCDLPGCPANDNEPREITGANRMQMRKETTRAAQHAVMLLSMGWTQGAFGVVSDVSDRWGFLGVSRLVYCATLSGALLAPPESGLFQRSNSGDIRAKLADLTDLSAEDADSMATHLLMVGDQTHAAVMELLALAKVQDEAMFVERFDKLTDQEELMQPLIVSLLFTGMLGRKVAATTHNRAGLDQVDAALRKGLDTDVDDEISSLNALLDLPAATDGD